MRRPPEVPFSAQAGRSLGLMRSADSDRRQGRITIATDKPIQREPLFMRSPAALSISSGAGTFTTPGLFFNRADKKEQESEVACRLKEEQPDEHWLYCRTCGTAIVHKSERIVMLGAHHHTFTNPSGRTFNIGCFGSVVGCTHVGIESDEYTWFPGYAWILALCSGCGNHLGWRFRGDGKQFHGLILDRLISKKPL
jgi:hypothetical protein